MAELLDGGFCGLEDIRRGVGVPGLGDCFGKQTEGLGLLTLLADVDLLDALTSLCLVFLVHDHGQLHLHAVVLHLHLLDLPPHHLDPIPGVVAALLLALDELCPPPLLFPGLLLRLLLVVGQPLTALALDLLPPPGLGLRLPDLLLCPW